MGRIRELPPSVVNQIAAGEVVERPASVVKELLENAIDAGATRVELSVERGGKDLIRVADDGCGIARDDLTLAFTPHATSKLESADDLHRVRTLGFRGEALAAIAEISRVRCLTRTPDDAIGSELAIEAGIAAPIRDAAASPGTVIEVRNLFFNTPVRRTFLKSDATEAGHVAEMFTRVALASPSVHMTMRSGGRVLHDLPATMGLKERIAALIGRDLAEGLLWVESRLQEIHVRGYVGHPSQSRSSAKGQYLFVGGRYVRDRALGHALSEAYRGLLMVGRQPVAFLFLDLPPEEVDVNVHPMKIEVRFRDGHRVYSQLLSTVRQTFLASDLHARLQVGPEEAADHSATAAAVMPAPAPAPATPTSPDALSLWPGRVDRQEVASWFTPARPASASGATLAPPASPTEFEWARNLPPAPPPGPAAPFDEFDTTSPTAPPPAGTAAPVAPALASGRPLEARASHARAIQLHDSYLIAETEDGIVVIDQHALHERILYEELRDRLARGGVEAQRLLVPEPVELSAADAAAVVERQALLASLGLQVEPFGGTTVLVSSQPTLLAHVPVDRLIRDLADHFRSSTLPPTPDALADGVLSTMACKAAVKAGDRLGPEEIDSLLRRRHLAANTHHCPHGRPAALVFTKSELERQFGRI
jgi:DNA mismatch repair protein MutL